MNNSLLEHILLLYYTYLYIYILYFNNYGEGEVCQKRGLHRDASPLISRVFFQDQGGVVSF